MTKESETLKVALQKEAPEALLLPTQQVVEAAMRKIKAGAINKQGVQRISLQNTDGTRLFQVTNTEAERTAQGVISKGFLHLGLFIEVIHQDSEGNPLREDHYIHMPRDPSAVTPASISHLANIPPEQMLQFAADLTTATRINKKTYTEKQKKLREREK